MKRDGRMLIYLAGGLVLGINAQAVTADPPDNPYQGIVERNAFDLKPPPAPPTLGPLEPNPPNITLQGITSWFGKRQAFFKTLMPGSKLGAPPQETYMVLSVGQREGGIEVLAMDESKGTVTFRNHGKEQTLEVVKDGPKLPTGPAPAPVPGIRAPGVPGIRSPVPAFKPTQSSEPMPGARGTAAKTTQSGQQKPSTPEEQAVIMLLNKAQNPDGPPLPPIPGINE